MARSKPTKTRDASAILRRVGGSSAELEREIRKARLNVRLAQMIYDTRTRARMTQAELAKLVGTTQSVISRLEDADYEGHSLAMLERIARALQKRIEIRFLPDVA